MQYRVMWVIDVEADSHMEAAKMALEIQRDPTSLATVFTVLSKDGQCVKLDTDTSFHH